MNFLQREGNLKQVSKEITKNVRAVVMLKDIMTLNEKNLRV